VKHKVKDVHFVVPLDAQGGCAADADEGSHAA
jgi:hypothetical protein